MCLIGKQDMILLMARRLTMTACCHCSTVQVEEYRVYQLNTIIQVSHVRFGSATSFRLWVSQQ